MIYNVDKFTDYLVQYQLTANQFYICWLIYKNDFVNLKKYIQGVGKFDGEDFAYLEDRGFILNTNPKSKEYSLANLIVTLEFLEQLHVDEEEAFDELLQLYPKYVEVDGRRYPTTGLTLQDHELGKNLYQKVIKNNRILHIKILNLIREWKKEVGETAPFKIDKFITSKYWNELEKRTENAVKPRIY